MMMMDVIMGWVVATLVVLFALYTVYFNVIRITAKWKCRKKDYNETFKPCNESGCRYSRYCENHTHEYSADEIAQLKRRLDDMKE